MKEKLQVTIGSGLNHSIQNLLLIVVLVVATAYRFYGIDQTGLWGNELTNAGYVSQTGWLSMLTSVIYKEMDPPGFLSLLYLQHELLGSSEFALRFCSAVAGVGSVWMLVLLGQRCGSIVAGFVAAALLAGAPFAVSFSQEVQPYSVFTFVVLAQCYVFIGLFLIEKAQPPEEGGGLAMTDAKDFGKFSPSWNPSAAVDPVALWWFWINTLLMLSLNYAGLIILLFELILCILILKRTQHDSIPVLFKQAFYPVFIGCLVWLPGFWIHIQKVLPFFGWQWLSPADTVDLLPLMLGYCSWLKWATFLAFIGSVCFIVKNYVSQCRSNNDELWFFILCLVLFFIAIVCLSKIVIALIQFRFLLLTIQPFIFLVAASVFFVVLGKHISLVQQWLIAIPMLIAVLFSQVGCNYSSGLFSIDRKPDLRPAMQIIVDDKKFMDGYRTVFLSNALVEYYLVKYGIRKEERFIVDQLKPASADKVVGYFANTDFYYLGVINSTATEKSSPLLESMVSHYGAICISRFKAVQLVKFSINLPPNNLAHLESCDDISNVASSTEVKAP